MDDDGDGEVDEGFDPEWYCQDQDEDTFGGEDCAWRCDRGSPGDRWTTRSGDCDDDDDRIYPGAPESCNVSDDNCDGVVDEGLETGTVYVDSDLDGHGDPDRRAEGCLDAFGWSTLSDDCDDDDAGSYPGNTETCNGVDDDCDGTIDDGFEGAIYADEDEDGYGDPGTFLGAECAKDLFYGAVTDHSDCFDHEPQAHPGARELCATGIDEDCDGLQDCEDDECEGNRYCGETVCDDHLDDEDDGYTDCNDDECWGDAACPRRLVSLVTGGRGVAFYRGQSILWEHNTCSWDSAESREGRTGWRGTAYQVEGILRVYDPGDSSALSCSWGMERVHGAWHRSWRSASVSTSSSSSYDRSGTGFWVVSGCGVYDSAFLPRSIQDSADWLDRYPFLNGRWYSSFNSDGPGFSSASCIQWSIEDLDSSVWGRPLGVGDRFVYEP